MKCPIYIDTHFLKTMMEEGGEKTMMERGERSHKRNKMSYKMS
jgi:hypothetical protein